MPGERDQDVVVITFRGLRAAHVPQRVGVRSGERVSGDAEEVLCAGPTVKPKSASMIEVNSKHRKITP